MNNKPPGKKSSYHDILFNSFIEDMNASSEMTDEVLKEYGMSPHQVATQGELFVGKELAKVRLKEAKEKKQSIFQKAKLLLTPSSLHTNENAKEKLVNILIGVNKPEFQFAFNNLKDFNPDEILQMLDEAQLLQFIEQVELGKNSEY